MNVANHFTTKIQPQIGKWSSKALWERLSRAKKAIGDAYSRVTGKTNAEKPCKEISAINSSELHTIPRASILRRLVHTKGAVRCKQQLYRYSRQMGWCRGGNRYFSRDYLWRRMGSAHLIGFATLFLASEERAAEEVAFQIRRQEYEAIFDSIKDMFSRKAYEWGTSVDNPSLGDSLTDYNLGNCIQTGCNGAVYEAEAITSDSADRIGPASGRRQVQKQEKLAIKMIFNFNSSNAGDVWRATKAEMVTCGKGAFGGMKDWQNGTRYRMKRLPPHPNIIEINKVIFDKVPKHKDFITQHPAALPRPEGLGRSTAMFLVMKRYKTTLADLLKSDELTSTSRTLLALQLLNGVAHLERNKVAHRDLKSNNILIESDASGIPRLTIADFGCALAAELNNDLILSEKFDLRNGAASVQPPEIANCMPNPMYTLDYRKSDAWAVGLLLCEIFGIDIGNRIDDGIFHDNDERSFICGLIKMLLQQEIGSRISCSEASKALHLHLFGPNFSQNKDDNEHVVCRWILMHAAETVAYRSTEWGRDSVVCELFYNFLSSVSLNSLRSSLVLWRSLY